jgi:hypothetical protein
MPYVLVSSPMVDWPGLAKPPEKRKVGGSTPPLTTTSSHRICSADLRILPLPGTGQGLLTVRGSSLFCLQRSFAGRLICRIAGRAQ